MVTNIMLLETSKFGEVEVNEDLIFIFVEPILGYEHLKKYALIDHMTDSPFKWLQSVEDKNVSFPITVPSFFGINYEFVIPEDEAKKLEAKSAEDILSLNIVNIPNGHPENATINLLGPVVVNVNNKKAMQLVLRNSEHSVRYRLFDEGIKFESKKEADVPDVK